MSESRTVNGVEYKSFGTHETHCCAKHGCAYGGVNPCAVVDGATQQAYACEHCKSVGNIERKIAALKDELEWTNQLIARGLSVTDHGYDEYED